MVLLTREIIEGLRTPDGGFNRATIEALGLSWPLTSGWIERAVGCKVADRNYQAAIEAKDERRHFYRGNTRRRS